MTGPRQVVEEALARLNAHDLDGYHALLHDDVVVIGEITMYGDWVPMYAALRTAERS